MKSENYISALSYDWLTPFYDTVVRLTTRETIFKKALVEQAKIKASHGVLDLACGTGTLTILIKISQPQAEVIGIDGDAKILEIAEMKAKKSNVGIRFDEGMAFDLPYADESFDRVQSSLFFHHLTRENKMKTFLEVKRVLKADGDFHLADWGLPSNFVMKIASFGIELLDGKETTADNFNGNLPTLIKETEFSNIAETAKFDTVFGTIRLLKIKK